MKTTYIQVEKKNAEKIRKQLIENNLQEHEFSVKTNETHVFLPIKLIAKNNPQALTKLKKITKFELVELNAKKNYKPPRSLKDALLTKLSKEEIELLVTSFDVIGNLAIVDIPETLLKKKKLIGKALLSIQKGVTTVAMRTGIFSGEFRVRPIEVIAGVNTTISTYKEHGSIMKIDLSKMYFSPRLSNERKRISKEVKEKEDVAVLFAGVGPFALAICKYQPKVNKVVAVELNDKATTYLKKNIKINHLEHKIIPIQGNVRKVKEIGLNNQFDRVLMPLPKGAYMFLNEAIDCIKKTGGVLHFYHFANEKNLYAEAEQMISDSAKRKGFESKIILKQKVRPYAPHVFQVVLDVQLLPKT